MEDDETPWKKRKPEEISAKLPQVDARVSQGKPVAEAVRTIGSEARASHAFRAVPTAACDPGD